MDATDLGPFSGSTAPDAITSSGPYLYVHMTSDNSATMTGFEAQATFEGIFYSGFLLFLRLLVHAYFYLFNMYVFLRLLLYNNIIS